MDDELYTFEELNQYLWESINWDKYVWGLIYYL